MLKQKKWYKYKRDARVGDVVLWKEETAAGQTYKYAEVLRYMQERMEKFVLLMCIKYQERANAEYQLGRFTSLH